MPSRKYRRQSKHTTNAAEIEQLVDAAIARRFSQQPLPPGAAPRNISQDAMMMQMQMSQASAKDGTPMFSPGAPLEPATGMVNPQGPRQWQFPVGYNIYSQPRSTEATSFDTLRNLSMLYDGAQLCEQVWLDTVAKLRLEIKLDPDYAAASGETEEDHADEIKAYKDFFSMPDRGNGYDLKSWLRAATRETLQLDALAIYVRRNRGGGVYSLEIVDGATIKPLLDPRGRRPAPPYPSYQQFIYGVPAGWYTSDDMIYFRETVRTDSPFGLSRNERIILRINQALRKQNKDLSRFTEGNIPASVLEPPDDGSQWTPEQLALYQEFWDALLAGNDQARSRIKVVQPGSKLTMIDEGDIFVDFDRFLLNITAACYSMTMADLGFTESVNKSSGDSQENVFYRRAVQPLMDRFAQMFTQILRVYFGETRFVVAWGGYEEAEDFGAQASAYKELVAAGIIGPTAAARQMKLPVTGPEIPAFVMTKDGPVFLEDIADPGMRQAANDAKKAGYEMAQNPPEPQANGPDNVAGGKAAKGDEKQQKTPPEQGASGKQKADEERAEQPDFFAPAARDGGLPAKPSLPWRRSSPKPSTTS